MKTYKVFSIMELMTVIFIILVLMSLMIPVFLKLKMNARNTLCKNQMRQIGILFNSYANDHEGCLPNDLKSDIPRSFDANGYSPNCGTYAAELNNELYANWNGHLLPYIDSGLKNYHRMSKLRRDGEVYTYDYIYSKNEGSINPTNQLDGGWIVIKDAVQKGGFNELKLFICPEIFVSTFDVGVSNDFNGLKIPRISELANYEGFTNMGYGFLEGGVPSTYLANNILFGFDGYDGAKVKSLRLDQIKDLNQKALLVEGGLAWAKNTNGSPCNLYYGSWTFTGDYMAKNLTGCHRKNFVHDTYETYWVMDGFQNFARFPNYFLRDKNELANKFNLNFVGKAFMTECDDSYSIISYIDPANKPFDSFFIVNKPDAPLLPFVMYDEPEYHYLTGCMNILFGDNSVLTKNDAWLSMNKLKIGSN